MTLFDEPYAGLDAVARQVFYDRLLADFAEFPRTVLLSTHFIDEAAALFEGVIALDRGQVVLDAPTDVLRGVATRVSGPCLAVDALADGRPVWERRRLGSHAVGLFAVWVYGMWHGIVNRRWGGLGTLAFIALQVVVVVTGARVAAFEHWHFRSAAGAASTGLTTLGLTGLVAALAVLLLAGGHATIRRAAV